ncbi:bifunctional [glutamate--ammonia ligase]-adenylyl-L-tyrosine phosphorylase/[glutamate--ammonia-ligase] adenylyltransferase [Erythrobacter rubeus]|uniref:Bifunctional [glutamate--ammonia ligase]-adenylyl-L-tyrosine phosphorylase/[glutamate--ammonia-ligase] adenylyltransferase n=1 Tax=Erythrobacter rubeus TaxID=2760803 RepID=A0ABR8KQM5_9SPHN|nr:bifunctional [glutamate--ammonia ligase]-adenylyl-L-tyrosine phosphorylase/[glutamate--ammonia-ligase] adenylyltransferase [Erythrobacter rubeus]MBD2843066.1 bifunctional [glutamate--ammonia ligase]-adenylyl-L-tyrosine phosphorylase/[glutamate--ammonia-ligase] adenylyltransferase [Erythrobacter rubeus]
MSAANEADWQSAIERAEAHAPFLARALAKHPDLRALLTGGEFDAALDYSRDQGAHEDVGVGLRRERLALAAAVAIGDLAGAFPLSRTVGELSDFADRALDRAIRAAIIDRTGEDDPSGFIALALGKQGAHELNYSSDIDPILLYRPETLRRKDTDDPGDAAQRYARQIVKTLSENTAEGYVLRVDLRLRPASEISPMAVPYASALAHYQGQALAWERAAFIRARAAAGDEDAGKRFLDEIKPFIWRSALDFGAVEEIRELTRRIRESYSGPVRPGPDFDVKRGRGGIREIEFFAQTHQLIHGGRDVSLRVRGTRDALDALAEAGRIDADDAVTLGEGYDRLREIEHRLQMVHDRQMHTLPEGDALDGVARLDGLASGAALIGELEDLTERTGSIYEKLIGERPRDEVQVAVPSELADRLASRALPDPEKLAERIERWRDGRFQSLRSAQALEAFDRMLPRLLDAVAASDDPERAIVRWEGVIEGASSAITLFRLLDARPDLLDRLVATLTLTPMLSDELARKPELLDVLIDQRALELPGSVEEIVARIRGAAQRGDYEAVLDAIRVITGEIRFALGVQLIEGLADPLDIGAALSRTAEAALRLAVEQTEIEFARAHGRIEGGELLILGLGRLGGGALTHASDLDIIYLFTGDFSSQSDGKRPLGATHYFNRLASRVSAALSVPTAQGALYEVDTRLRPQGAQGPLAVSCEAFAKYQRETAWTWEHMALARSRVLAGSESGRSDLETIVKSVILKPRDEDELREAVAGMRAEMAEHKVPGGPLDVKLLRGGLVDAEFIIHFLQLRGGEALASDHPGAFDPDLGTAIPSMVEAELLPAAFAAAYDLMTRMLVAGRLLAPGGAVPPASAARALAKACGVETYGALRQQFDDARQSIAQSWNRYLGHAKSA